ncbi:hypothetical protein GE09DRAFT_1155916 [Coniochaeta sp. 2T2.1]|nr:hypothetical protein GE09DRAFT_1155916 [Coniochaeta sp. 2T2.1]
MFVFRLLVIAVLARVASAHGGAADAEQDAAERRRFLQIHTNNLDHCQELHDKDGLQRRAMIRRADTVVGLQQAGPLEGESHSKKCDVFSCC